MLYLEIAAALMTVICIVLAGRNNIHTWWTGIVACVLYGTLFYQVQLYADATLQVFFIVTGILGWVQWNGGVGLTAASISYASRKMMVVSMVAAIVVALIYAWLLHTYTNAYAPLVDSLVLTISVAAQLLLMARKMQTWPLWLIVNVLSIPLYFSRELYISGALYIACLINAVVAWRYWITVFNSDKAQS